MRALANGTLIRPAACERCAAVGPLDAHHPDYFWPLDVRWLCRQCHADARHAEPIEIEDIDDWDDLQRVIA